MPLAGRDRLVRPQDLVVTNSPGVGVPSCMVGVDEVPPGWKAMDFGPKTATAFRDRLHGARTVVWNGPEGVLNRLRGGHSRFRPLPELLHPRCRFDAPARTTRWPGRDRPRRGMEELIGVINQI